MVLNLQRIALTGADGVLGRHTRAFAERDGLTVRALGRAEWDLRIWKDPQDLDVLLDGVDAVCHFGAAVPGPGSVVPASDLVDANVRACAAIGAWAAARNVPIVFAAGAGVYGPSPGPAVETSPETDCPVGGFYGLTKALGERLLVGLGADAGLRLSSLRITSLYGAGMHPAKIAMRWLKAAADGATIVVDQPADDAVNMVHAADVAAAALAALRAGTEGCFNVGGPTMVTMRELADACVRVAGRGKVVIGEREAPRPALARFHVSSNKALAAFGYAPRIGLIEGLAMTKGGSYVH